MVIRFSILIVSVYFLCERVLCSRSASLLGARFLQFMYYYSCHPTSAINAVLIPLRASSRDSVVQPSRATCFSASGRLSDFFIICGGLCSAFIFSDSVVGQQHGPRAAASGYSRPAFFLTPLSVGLVPVSETYGQQNWVFSACKLLARLTFVLHVRSVVFLWRGAQLLGGIYVSSKGPIWISSCFPDNEKGIRTIWLLLEMSAVLLKHFADSHSTIVGCRV